LPASVGATLRVVLCSSRTPSCASSRLTASLSPEGLLPLMRAPSRNPFAWATTKNAWSSLRLIFTVRFSGQPVQTVPIVAQPAKPYT
jgi:hypothetical protein